MSDIVIDTQVLMVASGIGSKPPDGHVELLHAVMTHPDMALAFDQKGKIEHEYGTKMPVDRGYFGQAFVAQMASMGRIAIHALSAQAWKPVRVALEEAHFDPGDHAFVQTAMASGGKRLVAEEDDYSKEVRAVLKRKAKVTVCDCRDAAMHCSTTANPPTG